jgi:LacI family transcriptional regulator
MNKESKKVNINYIAKISGFSLSTVSRALCGDKTTNKDTAEKILKIAKDLNYVPDLIAKGLRQKKTRTIGVILNDPNNPFYSEILKVIDETLTENNYSMIVSYSNWDLDLERKNIITLISKRVDGIIISPIFEKDKNLKILIDNQIELVVIDCLSKFPKINNAYTDNLLAGEIATEHLIENGHKKIMLFTFAKKYSQVKDFEQGYIQALKKHNINIIKELIIDSPENSIDSGYDTFIKALSEDTKGTIPNFTGIVTISDLLAIGVYEVANELRISIPDTLSIVGYDNIRFTKSLNPPLTTVHQPRRRIGLESAKILLNNINNEEKIIKNTKFTPYLIKRASVKKII